MERPDSYQGPAPTRSAGLKTKPPGYTVQDDHHGQMQMIFICEGSLNLVKPDGPVVLREGDILLLREGGPFAYTCPTTGYRGLFFVARGQLPAAFRGPVVWVHADAEMRRLARLMRREIEQPREGAERLALTLGEAITWLAVRRHATLAVGRHSPRDGCYWAELVQSALQASLHTDRTPRTALASLGLSYRQLARHFIGKFGISPKQYQLRSRLREARELLAHTNLSLTHIAMETGFSSSQHFTAAFRRQYGCTPRLARKHLSAGIPAEK